MNDENTEIKMETSSAAYTNNSDVNDLVGDFKTSVPNNNDQENNEKNKSDSLSYYNN